ncbi:MAG: DUF6340 family protein [Candidatus Saccharibacteria bacterium]
MRNITVLIGIIGLFLLSSCTTLYEFPIEVFQPAKVNLPPNIKNITLASRNLRYLSDTLQNYFARDYKLIKDIKPVNIDSMAVVACFDSLSARLENQRRFSKVTVLPVNTFPGQAMKNITPPSKAQVQQIASNTGADAVVLLDMFSAFYSLYPISETNRVAAQVVSASIWTVYDPANYRILHHTSMIDTLYWDGMDEKGEYLYSRIPGKKPAIAIAAGLQGVKYSKNLVPFWKQVNRQILSCDKEEFPVALNLAKKNKWKEASAIWEKYTESKNKKFRLQSMYNLAVSHEMEGDIERAQQLLSDALTIAPASSCATEKKTIRAYSLVLAKRKVELEKIDAMGYEE